MIAQHLAVIGREHDDGVVNQALFPQHPDDQPDLVVEVCAHRVEPLPRDADGVLGVGVASRPSARLKTAGQGVPLLRPLAHEGHVDLTVAVHGEELLRRHDGRVRFAEGHVPKARLPGVAPGDVPRHLVDRPVGLVEVFRQVPWPHDVVVVAHRVGRLLPGIALLLQEQFVVVLQQAEVMTPLFVDQRVVEPDSVVLGVDVQLAHGKRLVAVVSKGLGHRRQVGHREVLVEYPVAVRPCRYSGHDLSPRGNARRRGGVGVRVRHAVPDKLVEGRRQDGRVSQCPDEPPEPVVGRYQQYVWPVRHFRPPYVSCPLCCEDEISSIVAMAGS